MNPLTLYAQLSLPFPQSPLQSHQKTIITITKRAQCFKPSSPCLTRFNYRQNPISKVVRSSMGKEAVLEGDDAALLVNACITRNLPPVLSLEHGLERIKEAVEELKSSPPSSSSGMYRFQVAVPPTAKALNWYCNQPESSNVFPLFFVSNEKGSPSFKSLSLGRTRGVFGMGSAVNFKGSSSDASGEINALQRFLPVESTSSKAYGFTDIEFDPKLTTMKQQSGSFHLFIPQIELDEFDDITFLIATIAWDDSTMCTFAEAVQTFQHTFNQARYSCVDGDGSELIHSALLKSDSVEEHKQMVRVNSLLLDGKHLNATTLERRDASTCCVQFSARLSPTISIANNMHLKDETDLVKYFTQDCPNVNALWASLIVEECVRLGLTYFCVAPGSRSSPLTVAAASHPRTTCIACIDERSLAFHALGYAKGSQKPAVVITSSGTAVTNLFPAVVEASQNSVPMLVLSADRPPDLVDVGANQAINQINHFGTFARHFFSLPPPTDEVSARLVLTTIDSAVFKAMSSPNGPIHVNCPFREPLANSIKMWNRSCVSGLDDWLSNANPFTRYVPLERSLENGDVHGEMAEVLKLVQGAKRGVLVLGSIHKEDDMWAALLLAKHLLWPVVVDIQSGLRLRKYLSSFLDEKDILFVDQIDQLLMSDSFRSWMKADVILQMGSRITGRRIAQMIERCTPCTFIMVDDHPNRHDPSNIMTHRIHSSITKFSDFLIRCSTPYASKKWKEFIRGLDMMAAWESSFLITSEQSLTEPYVARKLSEAIRCGSAVFFGNSMPVRDSDMYANNWVPCTHSASLLNSADLSCHYVQVTGNRGASGIDGLISTAIGFAAGSNKRVLMVMGDVSFLHDTNGLSLLCQRTRRKPMVIVVVNNHGGAIFSQLPIANVTDRDILDKFFYTAHNVSIRNLCEAHGVKHIHVRTKNDLHDALFTSQRDDVDCVVEVESGIDTNVEFHRDLKNFTLQASNNALSVLSKLSASNPNSQGEMHYRITKMDYSQYRVQLNAPPTSASRSSDNTPSYREGFVIRVSLEDGSIGHGEVAPLEIHEENLCDVEEQLQFLIHVIQGTTISNIFPLLNGSVSSWIWSVLGIPPGSLFPSVRCGLETALLSALASKHKSSLLNILRPGKEEPSSGTSNAIRICALIDSYGSPADTAFVASKLVAEGFNTIKIKVARKADPEEDIAVIKEVRKTVGQNIVLRADANRKWTYDEAVKFANAVKDSALQYIEEPVNAEDDIVKFCEKTGLPVALDETLNSIRENPLLALEKYNHSGIAAVVIKPGVIGGFENATIIARWAQQHGKMTVVSAAFESALGLSAYIQFACFLDIQSAEMQKLVKTEVESNIAHGFGTYKWFNQDTTTEPLNIRHNPARGSVEADATDAGQFLQKYQVNPDVVVRASTHEQVKEYQVPVDAEGALFSINVIETGESLDGSTAVFLHGFLGNGRDWLPVMKAISGSTRCIAIDLPGHGESTLQNPGKDISEQPNLSIETMTDVVRKVLDNIPGKVTLIGYSMGARISLFTALKHSDKVERAVIVSGSPGLVDDNARTIRKAKDDFRASTLVSNGIEFFLESWYAEELWTSFRIHPRFKQIVSDRLKTENLHTLGKVLSDMSIGRQPSLWENMKHNKVPLQIIVGEKDAKFKAIAREMHARISQENDSPDLPPVVEIPGAGHAVHVENPLAVISAVSQFIKTGTRT